MTVSVIVHIENEDPVLCEVERLPEPTDQIIIISNPRRRDGKDIHYLEDDVTMMIVPWHRVNFVQVMPSAAIEEVVGFVRE
ncbi:MAG: hypothetical protein L0332_32780 [Chloroflexi bacterium]|nr:hypothetical protein [Chloroflexota bacterium]MCI0576771.1 hypothetical protein [Chloroflexota bacterium]MCI0645967.1 hypothetical protein [Chloroflexota bacterium]MCI0731479.1 hypothetical protein [Chloroflexota bacterium]